MASFVENNNLIVPANYKRLTPTQPLGVPGGALYGGWLQQNESSPLLLDHESRYRTYSNILNNTSIVAAGVRYFLNLIGGAGWEIKPSEHRGGEAYAKRVEKMMFKDSDTPWHRIVRRAAMFKFYGFSVQEWTLMRGEGGAFTFMDVSPRPQSTIRRWHRDEKGYLMGAIQTNPQNEEEIYLPRPKIVYAVDDTLNATPEGLGLFRHLVEPARRLERYETLEGYGFETDLGGIPIGRIPYGLLNKLVEDKQLTKAQRDQAINNIRKFIQNHIRNPSLGMTLDSATYRGTGESGTVSGTYLWDLQTIKSSGTSYKENAAAIERINREIARILGVEQLLLGSNSAGSFALSKDKTDAFHSIITSTLVELAEVFYKDLMKVIWKYNRWDENLMPEIVTSGLDHKDFSEVADALQKIGMAGGVLIPGDPAIPVLRAMMGLPPPDEPESMPPESELIPEEETEDEDDIDALMEDVMKMYAGESETTEEEDSVDKDEEPEQTENLELEFA